MVYNMETTKEHPKTIELHQCEFCGLYCKTKRGLSAHMTNNTFCSAQRAEKKKKESGQDSSVEIFNIAR